MSVEPVASASIAAAGSARSSSPVPSAATPSTTPPCSSWSTPSRELETTTTSAPCWSTARDRRSAPAATSPSSERGLTDSAYDFHRSGAGWADLMLSIPRMRKPVVVAPHGHALAGGCGIVAAADVAIAAEGTVFGTSEITIGLFPIIVYPTLVKAVGARAAREMALTGRRLSRRRGAPARSRPSRRARRGATSSRSETAADELAAFGRHALALGKWFMGEVDELPSSGRRRSPRRCADRS